MPWHKNTKTKRDFSSYLPLVLTILVTVFVSYVVYKQSESLFKERLRERLSSVAATASLLIDEKQINAIHGPEDLVLPQMKELTKELRNIRLKNPDTKFIYILRKTNDPNTLSFVADADMLDPIDWNNNGVIDTEEIPPSPGEEYDISEIPMMKEAFSYPTADQDLAGDEWGLYLSGYAPVIDKNGIVLAILGMDVEVKNFYQNVQVLLIPFVLLSTLLILMLAAESVSLIRIWNNRVEILKELDSQKDELLGIVSHQLAKPITAIKWTLESLMDGDAGALTTDQHESLETMQSMSVNLADLVGMILDVSRVQLGRIKLDPQPLDLNAFFKEVTDVIRPSVHEKNITLQLQVPESLPTVLLDKRYTRMTMENLLTNAVKYTPKSGTVTLNVSVKQGKLRCTVADTGCGIPKADQGKIFDKMFRASNVRNTAEGNGFGLYVAKGAVEAQGGTIGFVSTEGKGTTFTVTLPLKQEPLLPSSDRK